jgi:hypothetical protein
LTGQVYVLSVVRRASRLTDDGSNYQVPS